MREYIDDIKEWLLIIIMIPFWLCSLPKHLWDNRKQCPYWDYPYCRKSSLVTGMNKPCGLGDAKLQCLHYSK